MLTLAAAVRFYGLRFGMPHVWSRPDELVICDVAKGFLRGDLNPHFWDYPTLFMYVIGVLDYGYYLVGRAAGWFDSLDHFLSLWQLQWTPFFMIARVVSAAAGTATVAVVYHIADRLFDRLTAGVAALFMALAFLHVRDSHFGTTDVAMTFCVALSFLFLVKGVFGAGPAKAGPYVSQRLPFAIAGAAAGAGASIKYNAVIMFAALAAAVIVARRPWREAASCMALFVALFAVAFVIGTPYSVLDYRPFVEGLVRQSRHVATPHSVDLGAGGVYHLGFSLRYGLGVPLLAAGIAGLGWLFRSDWRRGLLLASFPITYYIVLAPTRTVFVRYAIPLVPFLCVSAAALLTILARAVAARARIRAAVVAWAFALVVVTPSAVSVVRIDRLFAARDNRLVMADWMRAHIKPGSSIYISGNIVVQPFVDIGRTKTLRYWTPRGGGGFAEDRAPVSGTPDWLVIADTGVPEYSYCPPDVKALAADRYDVVGVFKAMDLEGNLFDRQDAFYYPYAGFHNARRGGPNYVVYARKP